MTKEMKALIKNHLECIDMYNEMNEGKVTDGMRNLICELMGMKMMLSTMGFVLEINVNPYFFKDKKPSTYSISSED